MIQYLVKLMRGSFYCNGELLKAPHTMRTTIPLHVRLPHKFELIQQEDLDIADTELPDQISITNVSVPKKAKRKPAEFAPSLGGKVVDALFDFDPVTSQLHVVRRKANCYDVYDWDDDTNPLNHDNPLKKPAVQGFLTSIIEGSH